MSSQSFLIDGIIINKTRLGESDLIVVLLDVEGRMDKAIAKGARKPSSKLSAHLELFNTVHLFCAKGRSLDIVTETKLIRSRIELSRSVEKHGAASCISEMLLKSCVPEIENEKLFDMTSVALDILMSADVEGIPNILSAYLLKIMALNGMRPILDRCVICGDTIFDGSEEGHHANVDIRFSYSDGGPICGNCPKDPGSVWIPKDVVYLADLLIRSTFEKISRMRVDRDSSFELVQFCRQWIAMHLGCNLRSLTYFIDIYFLRM